MLSDRERRWLCAPRGWAEAAVLVSGGERPVVAPNGAEAEAVVDDSGVRVRVRCGDPIDRVVLRSYCVGAAHMALGWVHNEGIAVDEAGEPCDLTIRSFGILRAVDMPHVEVEIDDASGDAVNGLTRCSPRSRRRRGVTTTSRRTCRCPALTSTPYRSVGSRSED